MIPALLAVEWSDFSLPAFILALVGLLLGIRNATKRPPPARLRPFNHFKLVNKLAKPVTVATSTGHAQPNGMGTQLFGPVDLAPPIAAGGNRAFDYNDPNVGPTHVKSVTLVLRAQGDAGDWVVPPIQFPSSPATPAAQVKYIERTDVTIDPPDSAGYAYKLTAVTTYYTAATGQPPVLAMDTTVHQIPTPV